MFHPHQAANHSVLIALAVLMAASASGQVTTPKDAGKGTGAICTEIVFAQYKDTAGGEAQRPAWAPNGKAILFGLANGTSLVAIDVSSGRVSPTKIHGAHPCFVRKKGLVAVSRYFEGGGIALFDPATNKEQSIVTDFSWWPSVTSDGRHICYASREGEEFVVRVSGLNGKGERILDKKGNLPQASPVEALVAFECSENRGIRVRQINDGAVVGEISCGSAPNWSPDGKIVSFFYSGNIWAMDTHGKSKVQLTDESGKVRREGHSWSPDGTKMVFYVEEPNRSGYKIVCVDVKRIRSSLGITP